MRSSKQTLWAVGIPKARLRKEQIVNQAHNLRRKYEENRNQERDRQEPLPPRHSEHGIHQKQDRTARFVRWRGHPGILPREGRSKHPPITRRSAWAEVNSLRRRGTRKSISS